MNSREIIIPGCKGKFYVDADGLPKKHRNFWDKFENNQREPLVLKQLLESTKSSDIFLNFGPWVGENVLSVGACNPHIEIHAFEPDSQSRKWLESNISLNCDIEKQVSIYSQAVADVSGIADLGSFGGVNSTTTNSLSQRAVKEIVDNGEKPQQVETLTYSDVLDKIMRQPDVLQIDIEGSESKVVKSIIESGVYPKEVIIEVHPNFFDKEYQEKGIENIKNFCKHYKSVFYFNERKGKKELINHSYLDNIFKKYKNWGVFTLFLQSK